MTADIESDGLSPIDYGRAFVIAGAGGPGNAPRFWIDLRTRIFDDNTGRYEDYYRTDACVNGYNRPVLMWVENRIYLVR